MTVFQKLGVEINNPVDAGGNQRGSNMLDEMVWKTAVERVINSGLTNAGLLYFSKASLDADLSHGPNTMAWVMGDPVTANNGIYFKSGAPGVGSWTRWADLPYSFIRMFDSGAGTANDIIATSAIPLPVAPSAALLVMNVFESNTGNVTINGKPLLTSSGNQISPDGITAGMFIAFLDTGPNFRLLSDQSGSAIQAAAELAAANAATSESNAADSADDAAASAASAALVTGALPRVNLAAAKALDTASITVLWRTDAGKEGMFSWRTGDYSVEIAADPSEALYFLANGIPATDGAWVRTDGGWLVQGFDARWLGLVEGDASLADANSLALQAAVNLQEALYPALPCRLPAGTIYVGLVQTIAQLGYSASPCAVIGKSGMCFVGAGLLATTLKLRDGESLSTTFNWNVIAVNTAIENVRLEGFMFDINGQNNPVSPDRSRFYTGSTVFNASPGLIGTPVAHGLAVGDQVRFWRTNAGQIFAAPMAERTIYYVQAVVSPTQFRIAATLGGPALNIPTSITDVEVERVGVWNHFNCAAFFVRDNHLTPTVRASVRHAKFLHLGVINNPGVTSLGMSGQSTAYTSEDEYSFDIEVGHCWFYNSGIDTIDHSTVFLACHDGNVHDCSFMHPVPSTCVAAPVVACEIHGKNNRFENNYVMNYGQGLWVCAQRYGPVGKNIVSGNTIQVSYLGVGTWSITPLDQGLYDNIVEGNNITLDATRLRHPALIGKIGVSVTNTNGEIRRFKTNDNTIRCLDTVQNSGVIAAVGSSAPAMYDIEIVDNTISGFAWGINANCPANFITGLRINDNNIVEVTPSTQLPAANTRAISVAGTYGYVETIGNKISASPGLLGAGIIFGAGSASALTSYGNTIEGATTDITDTMTVGGRRKGDDALSKFTAPPTEATWSVGDFVPRKGKTLDGVAPNRTITQGWVRMLAGSAGGGASVLGTHWAARVEQLGV